MLSCDCLQKQSLFDDTAALSEVIYRCHFKGGGGNPTKPNSTEMQKEILLRKRKNNKLLLCFICWKGLTVNPDFDIHARSILEAGHRLNRARENTKS